MPVNENQLSAWIRKTTEQLARLEAEQKKIAAQEPYISFKEQTIRRALKATPSWYVWEINFAVGAAQRTPVTIQTDPRGYFFAERIFVAWRPTGGATNPNRWAATSTDNPAIMGGMVAVGAVALPAGWDGIDFYFEYSEGSSSLSRMNAAVAGSILYRGDLDGIVPGSDGWQPSTTVTFFITPTVATASTGVFHICCAGIQCYQSLL